MKQSFAWEPDFENLVKDVLIGKLAPSCVIDKLEGLRRRYFWGGSPDVSRMAWIKWDTCLRPRDFGGLDIAPKALKNRALLVKWWWRFKHENGSLWVSITKSIYGEEGGLSTSLSSQSRRLRQHGRALKRIVDGSRTCFWEERWLGDVLLKDKFNRLYRLETFKNATIRDRVRREGNDIHTFWCWSRNISERLCGDLTNLTNCLSSFVPCSSGLEEWAWSWSNDSLFSVSRLTDILVQAELVNQTSATKTLRNSLVPLKVELFI
ncbi:uncharacterized protein [Rutidosis leptorrhynchoides]|uniref:uncharacterized protein n=1 Tax=Rutidosis leptorrhynchoides TaxID=125765 RepID=UPI003A9A25C4